MKHRIPPYYERVQNQDEDDDYFNRIVLSSNLTNLFATTEDSLVLTINANWGEGKTTFIKLWERELRDDERFIPIYYDAFENDFASDTFISIAVTIQKAIKEQVSDEVSEELLQDYKEAAVGLGVELSKMAFKTAVNISTGVSLNTDSFWDKVFDKYKKLKENRDKIQSRGDREFIDNKYDAYFKKEERIECFQNKLKDLIYSEDGQERRIIFFIDELDRCRPRFAIEVLEKIKHLFDVEGVNFVLAINRDQLVEIIINAYGVGQEDAFIYLQKFVHIETNLPSFVDLRTTGNDANLGDFLENLVDEFDIPSQQIDLNGFFEMLKRISSRIDITPRSVERILTLFTISMTSCSEPRRDELSKEILILSILKVEVPPLYQRAKKEGFIRKEINVNKVEYSVGSGFINYLSNGDYIDESKVEDKSSVGNKRVKISSLPEAAKIVDIYDLPKDPKKTKGSNMIDHPPSDQ